MASEAAELAGDDLELNQVMAPADAGRPAQSLGLIVRGVGRSRRGLERARTVARFLTSAPRLMTEVARTACEVGVKLAERLGMDGGVQEALNQLGERHDGKGMPQHLAGEAVTVAARLVMLADVASLFYRAGGVEAACAEVRLRAGKHFDPAMAKVFLGQSRELLAPLAHESVWDLALEAEPRPHRTVPPSEIEPLAGVLADYSDLKSPFTIGHSPAVAALAEAAGRAMGLRDGDLAALKCAALVHDLGRVAVSSGIWDKRGPLNAAEWERVRLHPYHTERLLAPAPALRAIAQLAGTDHERIDGSGYFRSAAPGQTAARIPTRSTSTGRSASRPAPRRRSSRSSTTFCVSETLASS
jgi:HD-GYP domain-containing protein (c-di-GMP phosphodiesterase class II)